MIPAIGVFDAGPLISFSQVDRLELIHQLFARKFVPPAVAYEVEPSLGELPKWIKIQRHSTMLSFPQGLGAGERAAIALAIDVSADYIVMDDRRARSSAKAHGLTPVGSFGLLINAKRNGLIQEVRPLMDAMLSHGLYASEGLYRRILAIANED